jgi:FkbM family methyltransferase
VSVVRLFRKYSYYLASVFRLLLGFENPLLVVKIFLGRRQTAVETVRLRGRGLQFKVRGAMDIWSIKETFLDRFYETRGFAVQPGWKVVDIGAGIGEYPVYVAVMQPGGRVFAFEPYPQSFALMQENIRLNALTNVEAFDRAIAASTGELVLDLTGGEPLQFQSHAADVTPLEKGLTVQALSLSDAFAMLELDSCDLLKLDCEGAEYEILLGAPQPVLEHIQRIVMEYHDNTVPYNHTDLKRFLSERGYRVDTFPNPVHAHLGYLRAIRTN